MAKRYNPETVHPPTVAYSHGVDVPPGARLLYVSGQVGIRRDGTTAPTPAAQCEQAWANVLAVLAAAGMGAADIVKMNAYVTSAAVVAPYRAARDAVVGAASLGGAPGGAPPASTLVVVAALADPAWVVEIECVAAKA